MSSPSPASSSGVDIGGTKVLAGVVDDPGRVARTALRTTPGRRVRDRSGRGRPGRGDPRGRGRARPSPASASPRPASSTRPVSGSCSPPTCPGRASRCGTCSRSGSAARSASTTTPTAQPARRPTTAPPAARASALMITMGTGIGGAVLLEGRVVRGANGMAGEFGHMQVVPDGQPCECGRRGCWEQYSSGNALVRNARALMVEQPSVLAGDVRGPPGPGHRADGHDRGRGG